MGQPSEGKPRRLGRYEIVESLAHGGMAELFVARLPGIEGFAKRVVLKRVLPSLATDREFVDMFIAEARIAATLDHQNIVQVHDIGHDTDGYFFAMEMLSGADVGELLRTGGGLPLAIALELGRSACAGLHYAHERVGANGATLGLVHRDVSPQNIFVTFDGAVKLLDWGIAKAVQRISSHYTRSGTLRGKIPYMSPEQCRGDVIDRRSDVFSIAVVLWEMTVGERLFGGEASRSMSDFDVLKQIIESDAPRPSSRVAEYPVALEKIVMRGLARDVTARYQTADELQLEIETFMRANAMWTTPRELAAFMGKTLPERAKARQTSHADEESGGRIVPFPGRATTELPIEHQVATKNELPPGGVADAGVALPQIAPAPAALAPAPLAPPLDDRRHDRAVLAGAAPVPPAPPARTARGVLVAAAVLAIVGVGALAFALGRTSSSSSSSSSSTPVSSPIAAAADAGVVTSDARPKPAAGPIAEDAHWFAADDYLVSKELYRGAKLHFISVAKMLRPPSQPRGSAGFVTGDGDEMETSAYWKSHVADPAELEIGTLAFCMTDAYDLDAERPATKARSRRANWILARVTDVADVSKNHVIVGDVVCPVDGVRVPDETP